MSPKEIVPQLHSPAAFSFGFQRSGLLWPLLVSDTLPLLHITMRHSQQSLPALLILFILCCHASCVVAQNDTSTNSTSTNSTSTNSTSTNSTSTTPIVYGEQYCIDPWRWRSFFSKLLMDIYIHHCFSLSRLDTTLNASAGFLGSLALITGLYLLGFGYRYYRLTTFLSGCISQSKPSFPILIAADPP